MVTQIFTLKEFQDYMARLPTKLEDYSRVINKEMSESLTRRIKFNLHEVAQSSTGNLRKSIKSSPNGTGRYKVEGAGYWKFLNEGRFPNAIPAQFINQHFTNPGSRGQFVTNPTWINPKNTTNEGFVNKSMDSLQEDIPTIVERGINKALQK